MLVDLLIILYTIAHEIPFSPDIKDDIQKEYLREIVHNNITNFQKKFAIYIVGSLYMLFFLCFVVVSVLVVKKDGLLRRGHAIIETIFKGSGQIFLLINYVLFIPSLVIFAEVGRCVSAGTIDPAMADYHFVCLSNDHF